MFKVGDKVICVEKPPKMHYQCEKGTVYTVSRIHSSKEYIGLSETEKNYPNGTPFYRNEYFVDAELYKSDVGKELTKSVEL